MIENYLSVSKKNMINKSVCEILGFDVLYFDNEKVFIEMAVEGGTRTDLITKTISCDELVHIITEEILSFANFVEISSEVLCHDDSNLKSNKLTKISICANNHVIKCYSEDFNYGLGLLLILLDKEYREINDSYGC